MTKKEIYSFINSKGRGGSSCLIEKNFRKQFPELYSQFQLTQFPIEFNEFPFYQKLWHFLLDDYSVHYCRCGGKLKFIRFSKGYSRYCKINCPAMCEDHANFLKKEITKAELNTKSIYNFGFPKESSIDSKEDVKIFFEKYRKDKNGSLCNERTFKKYFPKLYEELNSIKWKEDLGFIQKIYHYLNDDYELKLGRCKVCGKRCNFLGYKWEYVDYCSNKCIGKDKQLQKEKGVKISKYIHENNTIEKSKQTKLERYGDENYVNNEKTYQTKKKNHSFNSSSIEEKFANWLTENNYRFERQYKSEKYPFCCDFYLNDFDLYIEIQGIWTHGFHPYDKDNEEDRIILEKWNKRKDYHPFYKNAIDVWTNRDVKKREIAKENKLNYLEIFSNSLKQCINSLQQYIKKNDVFN